MTKRQAERKLQGIIKKKPVYLSDYEVERLKAYKATCERQGDDDLVFLDSGQPMTGDHALQQELQKAAEMHGLHLTFHGLRHGAGTILARAGFPLKDIQVRLGYAHLQTTMTYLEEHDEGQQYATEIASQFMRPVVAISPIIATNTATKRGSGSVSV
jgi:integrase